MHYLPYLLSQKCLLQPHDQWQRLPDREMPGQDLMLLLKHQRKPEEVEKEVNKIWHHIFIIAYSLDRQTKLLQFNDFSCSFWAAMIHYMSIISQQESKQMHLEDVFIVFHSSAWGWSKSTYICLGLKKYASRYLLRCHWCISKPFQFDWVPFPWNKVWNRTLVGSRMIFVKGISGMPFTSKQK